MKREKMRRKQKEESNRRFVCNHLRRLFLARCEPYDRPQQSHFNTNRRRYSVPLSITVCMCCVHMNSLSLKSSFSEGLTTRFVIVLVLFLKHLEGRIRPRPITRSVPELQPRIKTGETLPSSNVVDSFHKPQVLLSFDSRTSERTQPEISHSLNTTSTST